MIDLEQLGQAIKYLEENYTWWRIEKESSNLYRVIAVEVDNYEVMNVVAYEAETLEEAIGSCLKRKIPGEDELPSPSEMRGMCPDFTGEKTSEDHLRELREE